MNTVPSACFVKAEGWRRTFDSKSLTSGHLDAFAQDIVTSQELSTRGERDMNKELPSKRAETSTYPSEVDDFETCPSNMRAKSRHGEHKGSHNGKKVA